MKVFTNRQEAQIRKALDRLIRVGTAHIVLTFWLFQQNYYTGFGEMGHHFLQFNVFLQPKKKMW